MTKKVNLTGREEENLLRFFLLLYKIDKRNKRDQQNAQDKSTTPKDIVSTEEHNNG